MSWSFSATGKPAAVLAKARKDLTAHKCFEPEETIKGKVLNILEAALLAFPETSAVEISAGGSQNTTAEPDKFINSLQVTIKPIYGFVE